MAFGYSRGGAANATLLEGFHIWFAAWQHLVNFGVSKVSLKPTRETLDGCRISGRNSRILSP